MTLIIESLALLAIVYTAFYAKKIFNMHNVRDKRGKYVWWEREPAPSHISAIRKLTEQLNGEADDGA